jgi:hypothetical protein
LLFDHVGSGPSRINSAARLVGTAAGRKSLKQSVFWKGAQRRLPRSGSAGQVT